VNDTTPLTALAHDANPWPRRRERADRALQVNRWRALFAADQTAEDVDFAAGDERAEDFLRVLPEEEPRNDRPRQASLLSYLFSMRALQTAVIANGAALVALALLMVAPDNGAKAELMASAVVLALGLIFAAVSVIALQNRPLKLARITAPSWFAMISGAVSYVALALAAVPLI
jgi:hypothetical protein